MQVRFFLDTKLILSSVDHLDPWQLLTGVQDVLTEIAYSSAFVPSHGHIRIQR